MAGIGIQELLVFLGIVILLSAPVVLRSGGIHLAGPTLVLRRFRADEAPGGFPIVEIAGRASGFLGWLLTTFGLEAETTFLLYGGEIRFKAASLAGQVHHVASLDRVASSHCGYRKPIGVLFIGAFLALFGLLMLFGREAGFGVLVLLVAAGLVLYYALHKRLAISIETLGGMVLGLQFRRSIIENVCVDMPEALRVIEIINRCIVSRAASA